MVETELCRRALEKHRLVAEAGLLTKFYFHVCNPSQRIITQYPAKQRV
jgi:hypothetical protein